MKEKGGIAKSKLDISADWVSLESWQKLDPNSPMTIS
jgi:hypothetical protein